MKRIKVSFLILTVLLLSSCSMCENSKKKKSNGKEINEEKIYTPDVVWELETKSFYDSWYTKQYDRFYYIVEYQTEPDADFFFSKVDLTNGQKKWSSPVFTGIATSEPLKAQIKGKNCIIIGGENSVTYILDDENGEVLASMVFYEEYQSEQWDLYGRNTWHWLFIDNGLYWTSSIDDEKDSEGNIINPKPQGIVKIDMSKLDFSKPAYEPQYIEPQMVWVNNINRQHIFMYPVEKDGVIYFVTRDQWETDGYCIIGAFDTKTNSEKWHKISNKIIGEGWDNMCIAGNRLYIVEQGQGCYDLETGETIWEFLDPPDYCVDNIGISGSIYSRGITYWNDKLYFTNIAGGSAASFLGVDKSHIQNIQCIDANTRELIWGDMPEDSGSLDTKPHIVNGQCFVVTWDDLRVYNATTGELIGIDKSVISCGKELNASYGDLFVFFKTNSKDHTSILTAIKVGEIE